MLRRDKSLHGRVVTIGDMSVGKTCILNRLIDQTFHENVKQTVAASYQLFVEEVNGVKLEMQIWDTAGQEKYHSLGPIYYRNSTGAVVVFDVTRTQTYQALERWIREFIEAAGSEAAIVIACNKVDEPVHEVSIADAREWAQSRGYSFFETSAKTGVGVHELFRALMEQIARKGTAKQVATETVLNPGKSRDKCC
jgi:small GTP-binding protein